MTTVRAATSDDAAGIAEVHVASWRSSYPGLIDDAYLASMNVAERTAKWITRLARPAVKAFVADREGRVVGFCCAGANRGDQNGVRGEVYAIYLLEEVKGQGVGRALFERTVAWLTEQGLVPFVIWVFEGNPSARAFYERMGGRHDGESTTITLGDRVYPEVAYRW